MPRDSKRYESAFKRRSFLKTAGAMGVVGLAGCSSDGGDGDGGDGTSGGDGGDGGDGGSTNQQDAEINMRYGSELPAESPYLSKGVTGKRFAELVEEKTNGRVNVEFFPGAQLGAGISAIRKLNQGAVDVLLTNLSNIATFAKAADLANMPYLASTHKRYLSLINSDIWEELVEKELIKQGFRPTYYPLFATRQNAFGPVTEDTGIPKTPSDMQDVKQRVAGSGITTKFWKLMGANPTPIDWGEVPQALKEGVVASTMNAPNGWAFTGLASSLTHSVFIHAVPDATVNMASERYWQNLPGDIQAIIEDEVVPQLVQESVDVYIEKHLNAIKFDINEGMEFHQVTDDQLQQWKDEAGYTNSAWDEDKKRLVGDLSTFEEVESAAAAESSPYDNVQDMDLEVTKQKLEEEGFDGADRIHLA